MDTIVGFIQMVGNHISAAFRELADKVISSKMEELADVYKQKMNQSLSPLFESIEKTVAHELANSGLPIEVNADSIKEIGGTSLLQKNLRSFTSPGAFLPSVNTPDLSMSAATLPKTAPDGLLGQLLQIPTEVLSKQLDEQLKEVVQSNLLSFQQKLETELLSQLKKTTEEHYVQLIQSIFYRAKQVQSQNQQQQTQNGGKNKVRKVVYSSNGGGSGRGVASFQSRKHHAKIMTLLRRKQLPAAESAGTSNQETKKFRIY